MKTETLAVSIRFEDQPESRTWRTRHGSSATPLRLVFFRLRLRLLLLLLVGDVLRSFGRWRRWRTFELQHTIQIFGGERLQRGGDLVDGDLGRQAKASLGLGPEFACVRYRTYPCPPST
jgi:hypothetical protein